MTDSHSYNFESFKKFVQITHDLKDKRKIFEHLKKNTKKYGVLEFMYFLFSLRGSFNQYRFCSKDFEELKSDSVKSQAYTQAFMLCHDWFLYEKSLDFRVADVLNNLIELEKYDWMKTLFLRNPNSKIEYSENKEALLHSGFPFNERLVRCDEAHKGEFLYIQKLQSYFKTNSKLLIERVKDDRLLKDFFSKYSVVDRDFGIEYLEAYFGSNRNAPRVCSSLRKL